MSVCHDGAASDEQPTIHASAVRVDGTGVLVRGPSGSGKSSLVLALILADRNTNRLVADDRVQLSSAGGRLLAAAPDVLAGLIEIRGFGIVRLPYVAAQEIGLVVDFAPPEGVQRLPAAEARVARLCGIELPRIAVPIGGADGSISIRAALMAGLSRAVDD